jgi:hypothetical protein
VLNSKLKDSGFEWDVSITHKAGDAERLAKKALKTALTSWGCMVVMAASWK